MIQSVHATGCYIHECAGFYHMYIYSVFYSGESYNDTLQI